MPDGTSPADVINESLEFTIRVACECYCSPDLVWEALYQQPVMNGCLVWGAPYIPDSDEIASDAEIVLIVADKDTLPAALDRASSYKQQGRQVSPHLLLYLQDEGEVPADEVSGLILPRTQLTAGLSRLTRAVFEPVIPHGLVCIDWADTCHILDMVGQVVIEEASGSRLEDAIESVMARLRQRTVGRTVLGMQASIICDPSRLATRYVHDLLSACRQETDEDATLIIAAPLVERPGRDGCEVRLFARTQRA
jgi:hypothetical protein